MIRSKRRKTIQTTIQNELELERALVLTIKGTLADMVKEFDDVEEFNNNEEVFDMLDEFVYRMRHIVTTNK